MSATHEAAPPAAARRRPAGGVPAWAGDEPYAGALRAGRGPLFLRRADGWLLPLEVERWCADADAVDLAVLDRCEGSVLDVGCGPGRLVAALAERGRPVLGLDVSEAAVAHTRRRLRPPRSTAAATSAARAELRACPDTGAACTSAHTGDPACPHTAADASPHTTPCAPPPGESVRPPESEPRTPRPGSCARPTGGACAPPSGGACASPPGATSAPPPVAACALPHGGACGQPPCRACEPRSGGACVPPPTGAWPSPPGATSAPPPGTACALPPGGACAPPPGAACGQPPCRACEPRSTGASTSRPGSTSASPRGGACASPCGGACSQPVGDAWAPSHAGASVLCRSVFASLPGEGRWGTALLLDGNIGIGGDPAALLGRLARVLAPGGLALVETAPVDVDERVTVRLAGPGGTVGSPFAWARIGTPALLRRARRAGWRAAGQWTAGGRCFVALRSRHTSSTAEPPKRAALISSQRAAKPAADSPATRS
ncbi:methyltransferase domain-containing protein [Streptomyces sp. NPDC028635]|uniref:methyltransferase domain-containing protein n=1 Tax=Streptomyces sp. NPDC028635 TaxID=3154800 RepID=UPI0033D99B94